MATQPDQARTLLAAKPQLAYALFQAMLLMNIVDPAVLQRIQPQAAVPPPVMYASQPPPSIPPPQQAPPAAYPPYGAGGPGYPPFPPTAAAGGPPPPAAAPYGRGYPPYAPSAPVPPPHAAPPPVVGATPTAAQAQAALSAANLPEDQKTMLMQVLQLTPEQINLLDPDQKASIMALVRRTSIIKLTAASTIPRLAVGKEPRFYSQLGRRDALTSFTTCALVPLPSSYGFGYPSKVDR